MDLEELDSTIAAKARNAVVDHAAAVLAHTGADTERADTERAKDQAMKLATEFGEIVGLLLEPEQDVVAAAAAVVAAAGIRLTAAAAAATMTARHVAIQAQGGAGDVYNPQVETASAAAPATTPAGASAARGRFDPDPEAEDRKRPPRPETLELAARFYWEAYDRIPLILNEDIEKREAWVRWKMTTHFGRGHIELVRWMWHKTREDRARAEKAAYWKKRMAEHEERVKTRRTARAKHEAAMNTPEDVPKRRTRRVGGQQVQVQVHATNCECSPCLDRPGGRRRRGVEVAPRQYRRRRPTKG